MQSLLEALGGHDALEVVVAGLCERVWSDPALMPFFHDVARSRYEGRLVIYLGALLGGRVSAWSGRDLASVHADLAISGTEFESFVGHVAATLAAAGVSETLIAAIAARLGTIRHDIVTTTVT